MQYVQLRLENFCMFKSNIMRKSVANITGIDDDDDDGSNVDDKEVAHDDNLAQVNCIFIWLVSHFR